MPATIALRCPEFREIQNSGGVRQKAWGGFVFVAYLMAALISMPRTATPHSVSRKAASVNPVLLAPPLSKPKGGGVCEAVQCGGETQPPGTAVRVERSNLRLGVADDVSFEALKVLRREHGLIAFAPPDNPRYADHLFESSGSPAPYESSSGIDDYFPLMLPDIRQWPDIRRLAQGHDLPPADLVYLLFPEDYWNVVADSIRAEAQKQNLSGDVTQVTIRFSNQTPSGIIIEHVSQ